MNKVGDQQSTPVSVSVVVLTYNWPEALSLTLQSLAKQACLPKEVIVADDGSNASTLEMIESLAETYPVPLFHVWQEDRGFRAGAARNRGIAKATSDYIVLLDGDMVVHPNFIGDHLDLIEPGTFLAGGRIRATEDETRRLLRGGVPKFHMMMDGIWNAPHDFHRYHALRWPWLARKKAKKPGRVMSCNMGLWRSDALAVNGFDERMEGYGSEDLEFAARLRNAGLRQKQLKFIALAIHLEHVSRAPADPNDLGIPNNQLLAHTRRTGAIRCEHGIVGSGVEGGGRVSTHHRPVSTAVSDSRRQLKESSAPTDT